MMVGDTGDSMFMAIYDWGAFPYFWLIKMISTIMNTSSTAKSLFTRIIISRVMLNLWRFIYLSMIILLDAILFMLYLFLNVRGYNSFVTDMPYRCGDGTESCSKLTWPMPSQVITLWGFCWCYNNENIDCWGSGLGELRACRACLALFGCLHR